MEMGKRRVPVVDPVSHDGVRYEVVRGAKARNFKQNGGVIAAVNEARKRELWTLVVYSIEYDPDEEQDVQDVYIVAMEISQDGRELLVRNERRKEYAVNLQDRSVREITADP